MPNVDVNRFVIGVIASVILAVVLSVVEQRFVGLPPGLASNVLVALVAIGIVVVAMWFFNQRNGVGS